MPLVKCTSASRKRVKNEIAQKFAYVIKKQYLCGVFHNYTFTQFENRRAVFKCFPGTRGASGLVFSWLLCYPALHFSKTRNKKNTTMTKQKQGAGEQIKFDRRNFRKHSAENKKMIHDSLAELGAGRSVVIDAQNELIAGNGVFEQAQKLGMKTQVIETDGSTLVVVKRTDLQTDDQKRKRLALADNAISDRVEWDADEIRANFDAPTIEALHIELPEIEVNEPEEDEEEQQEKNEHAEALLNRAMQIYLGECVERIDKCMEFGFLPTMRTPGYARVQFLRAKYYGRRYERNISTIFCPRQFFTSAEKLSYYDQMRKSARDGKAGIAGFRHVCNDGDLATLLRTNYPIVGGRMPLDFPVSVARSLIRQYANKGRVLDPCHGWGGRLVAALLEECTEYVGVDPSPVAHEGVSLLFETYKEYQSTEATLIEQPYEDTQIEGGFDFALTSPPYFDVEQYEGAETSHERYNNYELWREKFYKPLIIKTMDRLKDGCCFALQVGSQSYPLREDALKIAAEAGYRAEVQDVNIYKGENNGVLHMTDEEKSECIIIIQK